MRAKIFALASDVIEMAAARGVKVAVAESLTGGLLAASLVDVPGASRVFLGGVVAYETSLKHSILGVSGELLGEYGPVHPRVAEQMALGAQRILGKDSEMVIGVSTTGVAGPDPDAVSGQLPGTVFLGFSAESSGSLRCELVGSREDIRLQTVVLALEKLLTLVAQYDVI